MIFQWKCRDCWSYKASHFLLMHAVMSRSIALWFAVMPSSIVCPVMPRCIALYFAVMSGSMACPVMPLCILLYFAVMSRSIALWFAVVAALEALWAYMGPHFMLLLLIYVLYSNVTYIIYPVSCLVEIKKIQIVSNVPQYCFMFWRHALAVSLYVLPSCPAVILYDLPSFPAVLLFDLPSAVLLNVLPSYPA